MMQQGWTDKEGNSIIWESLGVFVSPDGNEWSDKPYTKEQKKIDDAYWRFQKALDRVIEHLNRTDRSIKEEIELIKQKKSTLPRYAKDFLLEKS